MEGNFVIKNELRQVRLEAMEEDDLAILHVDWAEQHKLTEVKEIQTAFFNGRYAYDILTGYCYTIDYTMDLNLFLTHLGIELKLSNPL